MIDHYVGMLSDTYRIECFQKAIAETVRPGDVVVEIGAGVGTFAMFAAQAGARKVYAIEKGPIATVLPQFIADNGLSEKIEVIHQSAERVQLPELADLLITEDFTHDFLSSDAGPLICAPRDRLLKADGRILPQEVEVHVAPVSCTEAMKELDPWLRADFGYELDFSQLRRMARAEQLQVDLLPEDLLAEPQVFCTVNPRTYSLGDEARQMFFQVNRDALLGGLAIWFEAQLSPQVRLSNAPGGRSTVWRQALLFLPQRPLRRGDQLDLNLSLLRDPANDSFWKWEVVIQSQTTQTRFSESTFQALCLSPELVQNWSAEGGALPECTELKIDQFILNEMAAAGSLVSLAARLTEKFPEVFAAPSSARVYLGKVLRRYA